MKSFFEKFRDDSSQISIRRNENHVYPLHFHSNLEVFIIKKGSYAVTCNNKTYSVLENSLFIFDSYDIHSYDKQFLDNSDDVVVIIPYPYLNNFLNVKNGKRIVNQLIESQTLVEKLYPIISELESSTSPYKTQALVDFFCLRYLKPLSYPMKKLQVTTGF